MGQTIDIKQYIKELKKAQRELPDYLYKQSEEIVRLDMIAVIAKRVRLSGIKATGGKFRPYSTKPTLIGASSFTSKGAANKALGSKAKRRKLEWVTYDSHKLAILEGGYREIRQIEGRQTGHKDFERTGEMWRGFGITRKVRTKANIKISIGGRNEDSAKKIAENSEREGISIIDISIYEEKRVYKAFETRMYNFLSQRL